MPESDITHQESLVEALIEDAVRFADASPMPEPKELFSDVYVNYPESALRAGL
mgnify:FL=1